MIKAIPIYINLFLLMLLTFTAGNSQTNKASNDMSNTQTHKILTDKPVFLLEIRKSGVPVKIDLNGMEVYDDTSTHQESVAYPLNDLITSGKNQLDIYAIAPKYLDYVLPEDAFVDVSIVVKDASGNQYIIDQIIYDPSEADPLLGSSEAGKYDLIDSKLIKHNAGEIELGALQSSNLSILYGTKMGGVKLTQSIELETPLPRWKFLDSENIIDKDFLTMTTEEINKLKSTPLIKSLYKAYDQIRKGLASRDIESIIDLFDERSTDTDIAFYNPQGKTKKGFFHSLEEMLNDGELIDINYSTQGLYIESNRKVAYLYSALQFKYYDDSGYSAYSVKFRRENGKWIVTR